MYYEKLACEYIEESHVLNTYIKFLKKQFPEDVKDCSSEVYFRVSTLYSMYLELKHTGEYLMNKGRRINNEK